VASRLQDCTQLKDQRIRRGSNPTSTQQKSPIVLTDSVKRHRYSRSLLVPWGLWFYAAGPSIYPPSITFDLHSSR